MTRTEQIKLFFDHSQKTVDINLAPYQTLLEQIHHQHQTLRYRSDTELSDLANTLKKKARTGKSTDTLMVPVYALVKEACIRSLGLYPYDVQIMTGIAMQAGNLVEMQTGEGKTLAAVFPACLNALSGRGVHILTFNDYLACRDALWMRPIYDMLGLRVAYVQAGMPQTEKRAAYHRDVTYATAKEVGFDFLRDLIAYGPSELLQRSFHFAIVDEADALLIDEARNPLILAGNLIRPELDCERIARFVGDLKAPQEYEVDLEGRVVFLTEVGIALAEQEFSAENLHAEQHLGLLSAINLALQARHFLTRDVDYVVKEGRIKLVDEFTGRIVEDRKWKDGLQTAVEAKEGLMLQSEGVMLNSISFQHLIQKYEKFAAMTATARSAAEEFYDFYRFHTVIIPPNLPCRRVDYPDRIFATRKGKDRALLAALKKIHATGQPILIGTLSIKESEILAAMLKKNGMACQVLNAKNDEEEAAVIAEAGRVGAVTISTNMAGRGTDIRLGGANEEEREQVIRLGGLFVIGTNRHESERIDWQLRGRAGRQGDPGASRFFISFEDELMLKYKLMEILPKKYSKLKGDEPVESKVVARFINIVQGMIEGRLYDRRKALYEYASLIELQRVLIQEERQQVLHTENWLEPFLLSASAKPECSHCLDQTTREKLRQLVLFQYDQFWSLHLEHLSQVKEGIQLVRLGGQHPLRAFRKEADESFDRLLVTINNAIGAQTERVLLKPDTDPSELGMEKPTSTWTYVINEDPFGNQLSLMLMDNANIGFQVDFLSAILLFFYSLFNRIKDRGKMQKTNGMN